MRRERRKSKGQKIEFSVSHTSPSFLLFLRSLHLCNRFYARRICYPSTLNS